jgi:uncharacterized Ntn-hydrolase superfamily protein
MSYSIVARCPRTGDLGVAVHTRWFPVGTVTPHALPGIAVMAHQSRGSVEFARYGMHLLSTGVRPDDLLLRFAETDPQWRYRQVGIVDAGGNAAAFTGDGCVGYAEHVVGDGHACQANMMKAAGVPAAMAQAYESAADLPLPERMLAALRAAESSGGDLRGRMSAALLTISSDEPQPVFDLRVDDDRVNPLAELQRLIVLKRAYLELATADGCLADGDVLRAVEHYSAAARLDPTNAELQLYQGIAIAMSGDVDTAVAVSRAAYRMNPDLRVLPRRLVDAGVVSLPTEILERLEEASS